MRSKWIKEIGLTRCFYFFYFPCLLITILLCDFFIHICQHRESVSMPKLKQLEKCKHPNSRKTKALTKQMKRQTTREKIKLSSNIKLNILGEKIVWFRDHLDPEWTTCSPKQVQDLILQYLSRFNAELEQIRLKHSIGNRKKRQHASREDIIHMTIESEKEEYITCGLEVPNLLDSGQFDLLKAWTGELRFLQNFKLKRFNRNMLKEEERKLAQRESKENIETIESKIFTDIEINKQSPNNFHDMETID